MKKKFKKFKAKALLSLVGVAIGTASVIIIGHIGIGGRGLIDDELNGLGIDGLMVMSENISNPLTETELEQIKKVRGVFSAAPIVTEPGLTSSELGSESCLLWGIDGKTDSLISLDCLYGRKINKTDIKSSAQVALIEAKLARTLFKRENAVGKKIVIETSTGRAELEIVGIIKTKSTIFDSVIQSYFSNSVVYLPYTTVLELSGSNALEGVAIKSDERNLEKTAELIKRELNAKNSTNAYTVQNLASQRDKLESILGIITTILTVIGSISLVVAGLGIMTVMMFLVKEKTKEIGIKMAIGAKRQKIWLEFLKEGFVISLKGAVFGCGFAAFAIVAGREILNISLPLSMSLFLQTTGFSVLSGCVFSFYPALMASKLSPVEALRSD